MSTNNSKPANIVRPTEFIEELSRTLVNNHLKCSLAKDNLEKISPQQISDILIPGIHESSYNSRIIAITGAGASKEAELLLAESAATELKNNIGIPPIVIDQEIEKNERIRGHRPSEFETTLLACSSTTYGAKQTREKLVEFYGFRYMPILAYEILAHLLKHRFIDAIVNFNFDELLDQSIADELRPEEYDYVISDGDFKPDNVQKLTVLKRPIYIKPHGTISHPSTLRFTHEAYFEIPDAITSLLSKLTSDRNLDLIVFGFSMESPELKRIISKCNKNVRIFLIDIATWNIPSELTRKIVDFQINPLEHNRQEHELKRSSKLLADLWKGVSNCFQSSYAPRGISRHKLVSELFSIVPRRENPGFENLSVERGSQEETNLLWGRAVIEACLAIARGRGFISIPHLMSDRAGNYYTEYLKRREEEDDGVFGPTPRTLVQALEILGMKTPKHSDVIMVFGEPPANSLLIPEDELPAFIETITTALLNPKLRLPDWLKEDLKSENSKGMKSLEKNLTALYREGDVEIRLDKPPAFEAQFNQFIYLGTRTAIRYATLSLLSDKNFPYLRIVSELGEWIVNDQEFKDLLKHKKQIELIVADSRNVKELENHFPDNMEIRVMDWWTHNRHMTLAYMDKPPPHDIASNCKGIFWNRRLRNPDLRPIYIHGENTQRAQDAFNLYWRKISKVSRTE